MFTTHYEFNQTLPPPGGLLGLLLLLPACGLCTVDQLWLTISTFTSMPLAFAAFQNIRAMELLESPLALTPPLLFNIPILFILTLFFNGQYQTWQASGKEGSPSMGEVFTHWVRPSLPLALFMMVLSGLASAQEVFTPYLTSFTREQQTISIAITQLAGGFNSDIIAVVIALFGIPFFIVTFIVLAILQSTYLDKLKITNDA